MERDFTSHSTTSDQRGAVAEQFFTLLYIACIDGIRGCVIFHNGQERGKAVSQNILKARVPEIRPSDVGTNAPVAFHVDVQSTIRDSCNVHIS